MFCANLDEDLRFIISISFTFLHCLSFLSKLIVFLDHKFHVVGKLPASKASGEVVAAYRKDEWAQTVKLLESYVSLCNAEKVFNSPCLLLL